MYVMNIDRFSTVDSFLLELQKPHCMLSVWIQNSSSLRLCTNEVNTACEGEFHTGTHEESGPLKCNYQTQRGGIQSLGALRHSGQAVGFAATSLFTDGHRVPCVFRIPCFSAQVLELCSDLKTFFS